MEDVLDVYHRPYDPEMPVICMDEKPMQLIKETRASLPARPGNVERYDHEYERNGTASIFMFCEPLAGKRTVCAKPQRTMVDWAHQIKQLLDVDYPDVTKVVLVCDNLNTHRPASLYNTFAPEEARRLLNRLEIHYTPKHGSWLNIAEVELSALTQQCLAGYTHSLADLEEKIQAWKSQRDVACKTINWQFSTKDARIRLKRLYPIFSE